MRHLSTAILSVPILVTALFMSFAAMIIISQVKSANAETAINKPPKYPNLLNSCSVTQQMSNEYEPQEFEYGNNLLRTSGQEPIYCGEKIIIYGRITDQNCVPLADAKVYLWQVNCKGKYPYAPLKDIIDQNMVHIQDKMTFTGNGIATTNNKGEFYFVTIYPAAVHDMLPHVNIRVSHRELGEIQTILTLKGHKVAVTQNDPELGLINSINKAKTSIYSFKVVMPGSSNKRY